MSTPFQEKLKQLKSRIRDEHDSVSMEDLYDSMLDECYSFEKVGGSFTYLKPSNVLKEMRPTDYRCGLADYSDSVSSEYVEVFCDEYYRTEDVEETKNEMVYEIEQEIAGLENELNDLDNDLKNLEKMEPNSPEDKEDLRDQINEVKENISELEEDIQALEEIKDGIEAWNG